MLNPMRHARSYRDDIYEVYCPRLPDMNGDLAITAVTTAITRENWDRLADDFAGFEFREVRSIGPHRPDDGWYPTSPRF